MEVRRANQTIFPYAKDDKPYQFYGPAHDDNKLWVWPREQAGPEEMPDDDFPFYLSTGRIIDHWHTMSMTGRIPELLRANPYAYVELNPKDASRMGIKPEDMVEVESRRGKNLLPAKVYEGPVQGMVFVYWHDQHQEGNAWKAVTVVHCSWAGCPEIRLEMRDQISF